MLAFPGETDEEFEILLDFLRRSTTGPRRLLHLLSRSMAHGPTRSDGAVPEEVKEERWHRFMQTQAVISRQRLADKVGSSTAGHRGRSWARGRDRPQPGGRPRNRRRCARPDGQNLAPGTFADVVVEQSDDYDLTARVAD